jgi:hypothetical protein
MGALNKGILVSVAACVGALSSSIAHADYPVCGMDVVEFRQLAYTEAFGRYSSEMLVKWAIQPDLLVLSPSSGPDLTADLQHLEAAMRQQEFWQDFRISYKRYSSRRELPSLVIGVPRNTVFVFIDDTSFDASAAVDEDVQHALRIVLIFENMVDNLLADARRASGSDQASRSIVDLSSGEAVASASLIKASIDRRAILASIFVSFAHAVSPTFSANPAAGRELFKRPDVGELTSIGTAYFRSISDDRVQAGSPMDFFVACSG